MHTPLTQKFIHSKTARTLFLIVIASASVFLFVTSGRTSSSPLVISEFRFRGPNGANDEFVEIYNNTDTDHTVASSDGSSGYALAASDGNIRFVIPNGTVIPARGHYLGVNSVAYSLAAYPGGNGDASFTTDIPDNAGVALFNTSNAANFTLANRFDAVGSTNVANTLYREGAGISPILPFSIDHSFARLVPASGPGAGLPADSDNNGVQFLRRRRDAAVLQFHGLLRFRRHDRAGPDVVGCDHVAFTKQQRACQRWSGSDSKRAGHVQRSSVW